MLRHILRWSIDHAALVLLISLGLVGLAAYRLPKMSIDVFPELNAPTVVVMTEASGLAAEEVEIGITFPLETALQGLPDVRRLRSTSSGGLSIVWIDLEWGADLYRARQLVNERLLLAKDRLSAGYQPFVTPITSIAGEIMLIALSSKDGSLDPKDLRAYAEFELRNEILSVPGVAQVSAIGGELPEYQVLIDQARLRGTGLTLEDVVNAARGAHRALSAGYLEDFEHQEIPIRQTSQVQDVSQIAGTLIGEEEGRAIRIGDVAEVQLGAAPKRGTGSLRGQPAVILSIQKAPGTNTLALTKALDARFDQVEQAMPAGMILDRAVVRQSEFIERSVDNVTRVLGEAILIVLAVLLLFLMNLRTTLITLTSIPISLAVGLLAMDGLDLGLNVMTLGGLAVAIGVLVDDAIIDVENVHRRLLAERSKPEGERRTRREIIFAASNEIRPAMVFATLLIVMVFVPLLFLEGLEGRFFRPLAITYILSVLASLVVALTLVPALCRFLLGSGGHKERVAREPLLVRGLKALYRPTLRFALKARGAVLLFAGLCTAGAILLASSFGSSFLPAFNEGSFTVFLFAPPGTSLSESDRVAREVERGLTQIEGVRSVARRTGRAERDEHAEPVSSSEIDVSLKATADQAEVRRQIDEVMARVPGITTQIGQPIEHRLSHILSGTPAALAINVFGEDLGALRRTAAAIEGVLQEIPGARDVQAQREIQITALRVRYRHRELAALGLSPADAAEQVRAAFQGEVVARVQDGRRLYDLVVRSTPERRENPDDVRNFELNTKNGAIVRLHEVADIVLERSSALIAREDARRKAVISLNVGEETNLGDLVQEVQAKVDPIVAAAGQTVSYGGQFEARAAAEKTMLVAGIAVLALMVMLLHAATGTLRASVLILLNLPLALIGGIAAIFVFESPSTLGNLQALLSGSGSYIPPVLSIASLVGFITLFGIAVRNGILLVNHYQYVMQHEQSPLLEAIERGSLERLVPILMTAISSALGLLPLAFTSGKPGSELLAPLAIVTLGGLLSSTLLNLIVVPAGYALFFSKRPRNAGAAPDRLETPT